MREIEVNNCKKSVIQVYSFNTDLNITTFSLFDWLTELVMQYWTQLLIAKFAIHLTVDVWTLFYRLLCMF